MIEMLINTGAIDDSSLGHTVPRATDNGAYVGALLFSQKKLNGLYIIGNRVTVGRVSINAYMGVTGVKSFTDKTFNGSVGIDLGQIKFEVGKYVQVSYRCFTVGVNRDNVYAGLCYRYNNNLKLFVDTYKTIGVSYTKGHVEVGAALVNKKLVGTFGLKF